jgi:hypothetical protein
MGNEASSEHQPENEQDYVRNEHYIDHEGHAYTISALSPNRSVPPSPVHPSHTEEETTDTAESPAKLPLHRVPPSEDEYIDHVVDPILAAAAVGAAAKRRKQFTRQQVRPVNTAFHFQIDDEWMVSLQRFASNAKTTARTVATAAAPLMQEAAIAMRESAMSVRESANEIAEATKEVNEEYQVPIREQSEHETDVHHARDDDEVDPSLLPSRQSSITKPPEEPLPGKYGGYECQPSLSEQRLTKTIEMEDGSDKTIALHDMKTPLRRHRQAPTTSTPVAAFSGVFGTAYGDLKHLSPHVSPHTFATPSTQPNLSPYKLIYTQQSGSAASTSSVDAMQSIISNDIQRNFLAAPKLFVELLSQKLSESEDRDKEKVHSRRRGRGRGQSRISSRLASQSGSAGSVTPHIQDWMNTASLDIEESVFAHMRQRSMSPPGSPITESIMALQQPTEMNPSAQIVDLWDMIPQSNEAALSVAASKEESLGKLSKPDVILEAKPSFELALSNLCEEDASASSNSDSVSVPRSTDGLLKKRKPAISFHRDDIGSFCSDPGKTPVKKRKNGRPKGFWRAKSTLGLFMDAKGSLLNIVASSTHDTDLIGNGLGAGEPKSITRTSNHPECDEDWEAPQIPVHGHEVLNDELLLTSSLRNLDCGFPTFELPKHLGMIANLRWRQLVARWKHDATVQELLRRPCCEHISERCSPDSDSGHGSGSVTSCSSNTFAGTRRRDSILDYMLGSLKLTKQLSGFSPLGNTDVPTLTTYLTTFASHRDVLASQQRTEATLKHELDGEPSLEGLVRIAKMRYGMFSLLMEKVAKFATDNYHPAQSLFPNEFHVSFSVDIKEPGAIQKKADRKYGGDVAQVKDVLRSQLLFPDEGSLICAVIFLNGLANTATQENTQVTASTDVAFDMVRVKNLFAVQPNGGKIAPSPLPTGYRHVLVNIRTVDGFLIGKLYENEDVNRELLQPNFIPLVAQKYSFSSCQFSKSLELMATTYTVKCLIPI